MKKMSVFSFFFALCLSLGFPLHAQEAAPPPITGAAGVEPFVSRLKAAVREPQIKLTWQDSFDPLAEYIIYRHTQEITSENFKEATQIARVGPGQGTYIDAPPQQGEFFYAVLAITQEGTLHDVFIPFRNKTTIGLLINTTLPEDELAAQVLQITARAEQDRIIINFTVSRADRDLMLFRSTSALFSPAQLVATREAQRVKGVQTMCIDYPVPGIPYYYALVDEKLLTQGKITLEAGHNATKDPAEIPLRPGFVPQPAIGEGLSGSTDSPRAAPLPYYILESKISANESLRPPVSSYIPARRLLSPAAEKAVANLLARADPAQQVSPRPVVLEQDKTRGVSHEDYTLGTILKGPFAEEDWQESEKLLTHFVSMHITGEVRGRARFYKGQALFFQKKYKESFMEFLLSGEAYYEQAQSWLSETLSALKPHGRKAEG
jgi:hypothetical protein